MSAFNSTFQAAIPGSSLAHKMGDLPHEKAPKYVDPNEAAEFIWKQLHNKNTLKQLWNILENGGTVWAITRAILYKASIEGVINMHLGVVLYPIVSSMVAAIGKAKGINVKLTPKFKDATADNMMDKKISELRGKDNAQPLPDSHLKGSKLPKPEKITEDAQKFMKEFASKQLKPDGLLHTPVKEENNG